MNNRARAGEIALRQISSNFQHDKRLWECHCVYMSFARQADGWHCRFHENDLAKTSISRQFVFRSQERIYEAARRTGMESRQVLDEAVANGYGGLLLRLSPKQYESLTLSDKSPRS